MTTIVYEVNVRKGQAIAVMGTCDCLMKARLRYLLSEPVRAVLNASRFRWARSVQFLMCCCCNVHRHKIHLFSYGAVSCVLITTGLVFTVFAIFQKDSQIGKVWLAGPTTMVVGLVLCGKVIIDWKPAMMHGRSDSFDTCILQPGILQPSGATLLDHPKMTMSSPMVAADLPPPFLSHAMHSSRSRAGKDGALDCIIYPPYDLISESNMSSTETEGESVRQGALLPKPPSVSSKRTSRSSTAPMDEDTLECNCGRVRNYGSTCHAAQIETQKPLIFQGETFVVNERSYLI
uniref:Transmembrane protein n=1 Tax=Steinernema glaseri TaxID=37863 RepID=A0A1I8A106_9BILA